MPPHNPSPATGTRAPASPLRVVPAAPVDHDAVVEVLARAFSSDAGIRDLLGVRGQVPLARARLLFRAFVSEGEHRGNAIDIVRGPDGAVLATAVWGEPGAGTTLVDAVARLRHGAGYVRAIGLARLPHAVRVDRTAAAYRPDTRHWYLRAVGVSPGAQGRGLGGRLLAHRLALVDAQDMPAYLESANARTGALYRRHGFVPLQRIAASAGAWSMWRDQASVRHCAKPGDVRARDRAT